MFLRADSGWKSDQTETLEQNQTLRVCFGTNWNNPQQKHKDRDESGGAGSELGTSRRFDRIQLCFPLLYVSLGWVIHSVFCQCFRNTDNMFWFMDSFFAYFNYFLINLSAIVAADTHKHIAARCYRMRGSTSGLLLFPFQKNPEWREELCVPSCVLSSSLAFAPVAQRPARKKKINVPSPPRWERESVCVCVCVCVTCPDSFWVAMISFSRPNSLQTQADLSFCQISFIMTELVSAALPALSSARRLLPLW